MFCYHCSVFVDIIDLPMISLLISLTFLPFSLISLVCSVLVLISLFDIIVMPGPCFDIIVWYHWCGRSVSLKCLITLKKCPVRVLISLFDIIGVPGPCFVDIIGVPGPCFDIIGFQHWYHWPLFESQSIFYGNTNALLDMWLCFRPL